MFVYRRLGRHWGVGFGLPVLIFVVLPLWLAYEIAKAAVIVTCDVVRDAYRIARWAWRRWRQRRQA